LFLFAFVFPVFSHGQDISANGSQPPAELLNLPIDSESVYIALPGNLINQGFHRLELTISMGSAMIYEEQSIIYSKKDNEFVITEIMAAKSEMLTYLKKNISALGQAFTFDLFVDENFYRSYDFNEILGETSQIKKGISENIVGQYFLSSAFYPLPQQLQGNPILTGLASSGSCPCVPPDPAYCDTRATCLEGCDGDPTGKCYKGCMNRAATCRRGYTVTRSWTKMVILRITYIGEECKNGWIHNYFLVLQQKEYYENRCCFISGNTCTTLVKQDPAYTVTEDYTTTIPCF